MSEQRNNNQEIRQYLLGALPEAEAERLDELSICDDNFAAALGAAEKDLVDAYVRGELKGAALEQFESHYLASSLRRDKVKFAQAFQVFADQTVAGIESKNATNSAATRKGAGWFAGLGAFFAPRFALQWGLTVAALALLVAGSWLLLENRRLRQQMSQTQANRDKVSEREQELKREIDAQRTTNSAAEQELARLRSERERLEQELEKANSGRGSKSPAVDSIVAFVLAPPLRGAGQIPTVSIPSSKSFASIQLQLEPNNYVAYRVALLSQPNNETLWRSGRLKAKTTGEGQAIGISFGAGLLTPQAIYVLRVDGITAAGAVEVMSDYSFRVGK